MNTGSSTSIYSIYVLLGVFKVKQILFITIVKSSRNKDNKTIQGNQHT